MRKGVRDAESQNRVYFGWGVAGAVVVVLLLVVAAVIYVVPIGEKTYRADFASAGGVRTGDEVRIAGIEVGEVRSVSLAGDHVDMRFTVRDDVPVGDASSLEVRLLTPIGGHFVSLVPAGANDLGDGVIPREHTRTPFELSDTLERATPILRDLDGKSLRETVSEIDRALADQPDALRGIADNLTGLTAAIADRQDDLDRSLAVADEYIGSFAQDNLILLNLLREIGQVTMKLGNKRADVIRAFDLLGRLFAQLHRPVVAYAEGIEPTVVQLEEVVQKVFAQVGTLDTAIGTAREFGDTVSALLRGGNGAEIDQSASTVTGVSLCVPLPGKDC